jgi:hypothetical protein
VYDFYVDNHSDRSFTRTYFHSLGDSSIRSVPFTGELLKNRGLIIRLNDGSITFDGRPPNGFDSAGIRFTAIVSGGPADGSTLTFDGSYVYTNPLMTSM